ncbi:dihydrolipoyllysine-residue acetyltransferase [Halomonas sp. McH1-25]|uniref:dihydrolipoyllysine-residue acetyltransferase n=1 Tax=unclassified Halomonas TaxID=2609666 RepID=UPI001EF58B20|nr:MULTISPECIES: dihydrolipoyllysine-residue acetyltransferase [unclassified Halomonas]MCG7599081.1 dihydrolipoyllysine-residue acetyltransferase [Halomonas sp. McH1-25]MCP1342362.1 dihydrolipoyllysine-residue acetyltransferase [Halomonas sp. FL8]MCP1360384.1 dihydrolipoyllysine-residue acetyltransferase [Halomonas sp. BBD45]
MSDFILPDIGEGIVECELVKWLISEGDIIEEDQPVAEVMTDKALVEIPAPHRGRVTRLYYKEGETAKVHAPLFAVEEESDGAKDDAVRTAASARDPKDDLESDALQTTQDGNGNDASEDFILPDIGEGIVECEVVTWRVREGDEIEEDQPVVDVMTDKALVEITAPEAGRVTRLYYREQESARVHAPLFAFVPHGRAAQPKPGAASSSPAPVASRPESRPTAASADNTHGKGAYGRIPASPAVRRLVRELGVRLEDIPGSGKDGRVLKEDILAWQKQGGEATPAEPVAAQQKPAQPVPERSAASDDVRVEPLRGMQAVMARRMVESATTIPHFHYGDEIDVTELLTLRDRLKVRAEREGIRLTLMPLIMKAMALAIQEFPVLNSRLSDAGDEIHYLPHCNVGMAVDGKSGLVVPNVKRVERLSLMEIAREVERLTAAAREGRVAQDDLRDGTISISNIGALGGTYAAPIINAPEVAIVALGRVQHLPRFDTAGNVVSRAIMTVTWAGDHRLIDGGTIARFCNLWKGYLQEPQDMLLHLA